MAITDGSAIAVGRSAFPSAERTDTLQSATVATAALAMWVEAQESDDPERLGSLARRAFPDAQSRGSRYQLLLADLLEQRPEPELRAKARSIRQAFLKATGEHIAGFRQPQFIQPDGVLACWMALAYTREAAALRREAQGESSARERAGLLSRAFMAEMNAATAMVNGHRPDRSSWDDEAVRLGVGSEYLLTYAVRLQELAERARGEGENAQAAASEEESLVQLIQLTRIDGSGVDLLRAAFVRLRPDARWDEFWQRELTKYAPVVTAETLETATLEKIPIASLRGRWVMLAPWDPSCVSCADNLDGLERLSRASGEVLAVVVGGSAKAAARYLEARGRHLAVASVSPDVARAIGLNSPRYYLLSPDGRLVRLPLHQWEVFARHLLMQPAVPKRPFP